MGANEIERARSAIIDAARDLMADAEAACDAGGEYTVNARTGTAWVRLKAALNDLDRARGYSVDARPETIARNRKAFGMPDE